jgi:predicted MFS family arabinose efflux permease
MEELPVWFRISILALGTFAVGTDGFVVAGVLRDIADQTNVSIAAAGQLVTLFAWVYALASPTSASLFGRVPRRPLLLGALAVFTVGNVLAAAAPGYGMLALGRVVAAIGAATYTPTASMAAVSLAPDRSRGRALAVVMGGLTIATIFGSPVGTWLGAQGGFRAAFWFVTVLGVVALAGLALLLPALPRPPAVGLRARLAMLRTPGAVPTLLTTVIAFIAAFTVYTYISPMLGASLAATGGLVSLMLLCWGVGGALGNAVGGWLSDRWSAERTLVLSLTIVIATLAVLPLAIRSPVTTAVDIFLWGFGGWMLVPVQQHRLVSLAPSAGSLMISLNASAMYVGIGAAGAIGGLIAAHLGLDVLGPAGALAELVALLVALASFALVRRTGERHRAEDHTPVPV